MQPGDSTSRFSSGLSMHESTAMHEIYDNCMTLAMVLILWVPWKMI